MCLWELDKEVGEIEEDCDDVERFVLFDDFSLSLFKIFDFGNRLKFVLIFLNLFGVLVFCIILLINVDVY